MSLLLKNVSLRNKEGLWQILIEEGTIKEIAREITTNLSKIIDGEGGLALPPFLEPHIHLDTALTAGEPCWNKSGTLFEGIECWSQRKKSLSLEDVKRRAKKALRWQIAQGIQGVRTHVDVTDPELTALQAMVEVKKEMAPWVDLQIVAFPQEGIASYPRGIELLEEAIKMGADVVGAIPHFEFTREYGVDSVKEALALARKYNCLVDVHCDEIDDEQSRFLEVLAAEAYKYEMGEQVTASHTTAMHSYNNAYTYKLFRLLKMAKINFVSNPLVNIHLQGRFDTYPKRRGITRVKELLEAEINVCFGHDDIVDPWYLLGTGNMLQVLHCGLHVCQLMGYEEINNSLSLITDNSAKALNLRANYGIEVGKPGNLIILPARDGYDAVRRQVTVRYSIRRGQVIAETQPSTSTIYLHGSGEKVEFDHNPKKMLF